MRRMSPGKTELSFPEHLDDIRGRLAKCLAVYMLACAGFYPCAAAVLDAVTAPAGHLFFTAPADAFVAYWNIVLWGGFVFALPYILYHVWDFIGEGLLPHEKKPVLFYAPVSLALFITGSLFSFYVVLPVSFRFFMTYAGPHLHPWITLDKYISYAIGIVFSFAVAFELPLVVFVLAKSGLVTPGWLAGHRKAAALGILVVAAVLTPPDMASQLMLAGPMFVLYEAGIWCARWARADNKKPSGMDTEGS